MFPKILLLIISAILGSGIVNRVAAKRFENELCSSFFSFCFAAVIYARLFCSLSPSGNYAVPLSAEAIPLRDALLAGVTQVCFVSTLLFDTLCGSTFSTQLFADSLTYRLCVLSGHESTVGMMTYIHMLAQFCVWTGIANLFYCLGYMIFKKTDAQQPEV